MFKSTLLLLLASLLAACIGSSSVEPGKTTLPQLLEQLGQPSMVWSERDGSLQMEFARVTQGGGNFMARLAPSGVLLSLQQVLTEASVDALRQGMSRDEVRRQMGRPARTEHVAGGEVWHWPLDVRRPANWQIDAHFGAEGILQEVRRSRIRLERPASEARLAGQPERSPL